MLLWLLAGIGALLGLFAYLATRRLARRFEDLKHSYWELRYDHTRLRAQVARLDPEQRAATGVETEPASPSPEVAFVPLSSIKR